MKYIHYTLILLFLSAARLGAQGICDSIISIEPFSPLCAGTGLVYLNASHPWGTFSEPHLGSGFSYLDAQYLTQGTYTLTYTIQGPGGCTVSTTRDFEVLHAPQVFCWVSGNIDCSNPNSEVTLMAFPPSNYPLSGWEGPNGDSFYDETAHVDYVGSYRFIAHSFTPGVCPAYANVDVGGQNNQVTIKIEDCTNCADWPQKIRIANVPPGWMTQVSRPNGAGYYSPADQSGCFAAIQETGIWKVQAINPANGCVSKASQYLDTEHATPSVSAGSNVSIWCNGAGSFLAAMSPESGSLFNYYWTRPDGSTAPASYGGLLKASDPGAYVLHGVNTFTGCEHRDTAYAGLAPLPVSSQISIICHGENLYGHTQSGNYVDTVLQVNGCEKVQYTKLIVLAPIQDSVVVVADNGQMNGSIEYFVTQGWPPFTYHWSNGETASAITNLPAGNYQVTVTDANGCTHEREVIVPSNKPKQPFARNSTMPLQIKARLYPNPAIAGQGLCNLELYANQATEARLIVADVLGRNIFSSDLTVQEGKNLFPVSENLPEGTYLVSLQGGFGSKEVSKLVVTGQR